MSNAGSGTRTDMPSTACSRQDPRREGMRAARSPGIPAGLEKLSRSGGMPAIALRQKFADSVANQSDASGRKRMRLTRTRGPVAGRVHAVPRRRLDSDRPSRGGRDLENRARRALAQAGVPEIHRHARVGRRGGDDQSTLMFATLTRRTRAARSSRILLENASGVPPSASRPCAASFSLVCGNFNTRFNSALSR